MFSPKFRQGFQRFRRQKRAYFSLILLLIIFAATLPAELLCNSRPILMRVDGRWFFPVFREYTEVDFGGTSSVVPDYRDPGFWRRIGCDPEAAGVYVPSDQEEPAEDGQIEEDAEELLDMFGEKRQPSAPRVNPVAPRPAVAAAGLRVYGRPALFKLPQVAQARAAADNQTPPRAQANDSILDMFDPEPHDVAEPLRGEDEKSRQTMARACWALWPPVRYDYATIETDTRVGRSALVAPWDQQLPGGHKMIPSGWLDGHYLGTDNRGRDVLARLVYGLRVSLLFGILLAVSSTLIGTVLGACQGFFAGWVDLFGQRLTEIWGSLPRLYLLMILSSLLARNIIVLFVILNLTSWMGMAAYMRAEFLKGRNFDYVRAARALGVRSTGIMFRHLLPNSMTPIITFFPFAVTGGVLALVSLDFLNLGVPSPFPSLGELLRQGQANLHATWIIFPTFIVLSGTITMLTFIGDGLRNAFDPRRAA